MGWNNFGDYFPVSSSSNSVEEFEYMTISAKRTVVKTGTTTGNIVIPFTYSVEEPYAIERRRKKKTRTDINVFEMRGLTAEKAQSLRSSNTSLDPDGSSTTTCVTAERVNDADGWIARKVVTKVTVTRDQWETISVEPVT